MSPQITVNHSTGSTASYFDDDDDVSSEEETQHSNESHHHIHRDSGDSEEEDEESEESDWDDLREDIGPSESASRSQAHYTARSHSRSRPPPVRSAPRRHAPRKFTEVPEPPLGPAPRHGRRPRGSRDPSVRPRSVHEMDHEDDHPHVRGGPYPYHPAQGWSNVGLYPGQTPSALSSYDHQYNPGAVTSFYPRGSDPFGMLSPGSGGGNPFTAPPDDYFGPHRRTNRSSVPPRPNGSDMMAYGQGPANYPSPYGYPGFSPYGYPWPPPPQQPTPAPQPAKKAGAPLATESSAAAAAAAAAADDPRLRAIHDLILLQTQRSEEDRLLKEKEKAEAKAAAEKAKEKSDGDKLAALQKLIEDNNKAQLDREKKAEEKAKKEQDAREAAERSAADAKKAQEEKTKELKAAAEAAKKKAEEEAAKKAAEEKEKWDKEMEEQKKKSAELEAAKKKAEEEAKSLRPGDDKLKPPIKFKDALGRKFSFPWHICKTWKGMQTLILQAFLHVDGIGHHVHEGHYDLIGPDGEIILPQVWETMVKPDWAIVMQMWPMTEPPKMAPLPPPPVGIIPPHAGHAHGKKKKDGKVSKSKHAIPVPPMGPPAPPPMFPHLPPPPMIPGPPMPPGIVPAGLPPNIMMPPPPFGIDPYAGMPPPAVAIPVALGKEKKKDKDKDKEKKKKKEGGSSTMAMWFAGAPSRNQSVKSAKKSESGDATAPKKVSVKKTSTTAVKKVSKTAPSAPNGAPLSSL